MSRLRLGESRLYALLKSVKKDRGVSKTLDVHEYNLIGVDVAMLDLAVSICSSFSF